MKRILTALLFALPALCFGRKEPPLPDSLEVYPGISPCIAFESFGAGSLTPRDSVSWIFTSAGEIRARQFAIKVKPFVSHPKDLFTDCILIEPYQMVRNRKWHHFFIGTDLGDTESRGRPTVPASIRFYTDTTGMRNNAIHGTLITDRFPEHKAADYLRPFYFRKYEVSNKEYREFVKWVQDSIARTKLRYFLPNGMLDRKKKYDLHDKKTDSIVNLFRPIGERFYSRKDIDARKLNYRFANRPDGYAPDTINVYPDTLRWITDWHLNFVNEPMANMYFWHPAYDDYAVAGVTYWQCLAFLEWKTQQLQSMVNRKKLNVKVQCALPSEIEWDYVSTAEREDEKIILLGKNYFYTADRGWQTDVELYIDHANTIQVYNYREMNPPSDTGIDQIYVRKPECNPIWYYVDANDKPLRRLELGDQKTWGSMVKDGYLHPGPVKIDASGFNKGLHFRETNERSRAHYDAATGVCWMDGNVSEWMREDLDQNWRAIFNRHLFVPDGPYAAETKFVRNYEKYYYDKLPARGKLVRGANWLDERFALKCEKNVAGIQAKTFCDPDSAHSTIGFRYVIYLEAK